MKEPDIVSLGPAVRALAAEMPGRVYRARVAAGYSQARAEQALDLADGALREVEAGRRQLRAVEAWALGALFNCDLLAPATTGPKKGPKRGT